MTLSVQVGALPRIISYSAAMVAMWFALVYLPGAALATMTIEALSGNESAVSPVYDRFDSDPSFIGNGFSSTGVGMVYLPGGQTVGDWATMISPSYFISAYHEHPGGQFNNNVTWDPSNANTQYTLRFYESNNPAGSYEDYTNNPSDTGPSASDASLKGNFTVVGEIGNSDLWLGKLSSPVGANITKYPILSNSAGTSPTNFYNTNPVLYTYGVGTGGVTTPWGPFSTLQRVGRNQIDYKTIGAGSVRSVFPDLTDLGYALSSTDTGYNFRWLYSTNTKAGYSQSNLGPDESMVVGGDSGAPDFTLLGPSMPAVVGVNWFLVPKDGDFESFVGSGSTFVPGYVAKGQPTHFALDNLEDAMYGSGEQPSLVSTVPLKGDFNLDGKVTAADVQAMLTALSNPSSYEMLHGVSGSYVSVMGDVNGDGFFTNDDIQAFISQLAVGGAGSGGSDLSAVPEPTSLVLLILGGIALLAIDARLLLRQRVWVRRR